MHMQQGFRRTTGIRHVSPGSHHPWWHGHSCAPAVLRPVHPALDRRSCCAAYTPLPVPCKPWPPGAQLCLSSPPSAQHLLKALHLGVLRVLDHATTLYAQVVPCQRVPLVDGQCLSYKAHETALNAPSHTPQHTLAHHTSDPESHRLRHAPPPVTLECKCRQTECHHVLGTPWHAPESAG